MKKSVLINKSWRYLIREIKFLITRKPYFLNYPTATLCNHKCVMCNVHERKVKNDMSVNELESIIKDPLFSNIESIGLSGGEPFMRSDLTEISKVLLNNLKNLKHFSINSNGQLPNKIEKLLQMINEQCIEKNVNFNLVLSMDGVGEVHSTYRGKENAWKQLTASIHNVLNHGMTPSTLMTIHRNNYQDVFNVLSFCRENGVKPYFGIATIIERLGNTDIYDNFSLTKHDKYYIWEFLQNLSKDHYFPINKRIWYDLLSYQLLYDMPRTASCVAMKKGVYLGEDGLLSYCGVYDKPIQMYNHRNYLKSFLDKRNDNAIRNKMIDKHCNTCMHDYQSKPKFNNILRFYVNELKLHQIKRVIKGEIYRKLNPPKKHLVSEIKTKHLLLYGWFGTETIGDKAIYNQIINSFKGKYGEDIKFTIVSKMVAYTERTMIELGLKDIEIIDYKNVDNVIDEVDTFVFCGGPIMGYSDLYDYYNIAHKGKKLGKRTIIFGAGFGPFKNKLYEKVAFDFVRMNDLILLRDKESIEKIENIGLLPSQLKKAIIVDPAYLWALNFKKYKTKKAKHRIGISFRTMPGDLSNESYKINAERIEIFSKLANYFINKYDGLISLIPMNTYHVGGDDRIGLHQIQQKIERKDRVEFLSGFYNPDETIKAIAQCDYFVGVRFHSNVFANALSIPTIGIEYVLPKGKITSLYNLLDLQDNLINFNDLTFSLLKEKLDRIIIDKTSIVSHLDKKSEELEKNYQEVIDQLF